MIPSVCRLCFGKASWGFPAKREAARHAYFFHLLDSRGNGEHRSSFPARLRAAETMAFKPGAGFA